MQEPLTILCLFYCRWLYKKDFLEQTVRKCHLNTEAAANFIALLGKTTAEILPSSCDFIVEGFNSKKG